jgi:HAD superfamily hydrolase (TIGR01509 family)
MLINSYKSIKNRKIIGLVFAILGTFFIIAAKYSNKPAQITPISCSAYNTIIFDLGDVIFQTNPSAKNSIIAKAILQNPMLLYHLINVSPKKEYFNFLNSVPAQTTLTMHHKAERMPQIMVDWQTGAATGQEIKAKITAQALQSNYPTCIQNLFIAIADFMFTPETLANAQMPIQPTLNLAKKLKNAGYQIYALSNWDAESFDLVLKNNPEIFNLFDGFLISGHEKNGKPSPEFFQKLLKNHQINPVQAVFIDDEPNNLSAAKQLGIATILCTQPEDIVRELIGLGVLTLSS